jgi:hypothetical protein
LADYFMDLAPVDQPAIPPDAVHTLIDDAIRSARFFVGPDLHLMWQPPVFEETPWDVFRGRLLDPAHTRRAVDFTAWNVYQVDGEVRSAEPLLSVKLDRSAGNIHVVRAVLSYAWEGFDAGNNVVQSRQRAKWVRELVGTISLEGFTAPEELREELMMSLDAAVRGTSRLPLNSVEAPLPAYSLGQLAYLPSRGRHAAVYQPARTWQELLAIKPIPLESVLRSITPLEAPGAAKQYVAQLPAAACDLPRALRQMFTDVSLSPYTSFVDTTVAFVKALVELGAITCADEVDFWGWLLRQLGRHLTAYDLITFHYRGANYPDALLLDTVLKRYFLLIEACPQLFQGNDPGAESSRRLRRRALRQACLLRRYYEGLSVPDEPTSPGENARILPPPHARVPDEQLVNVLRRRKQLYTDEPLAALLTIRARAALRESILDLFRPREWRELGTAVFIDRPFGWGKEVGEPDLTPLLAHVAFSPSIARRRAAELAGLILELKFEGVGGKLLNQHGNEPGWAAAQLAEPDRPIVSLADARRVADDFVILRTLRYGLEEVFSVLDFTPLRTATQFPSLDEQVLVVGLPGPKSSTVLTWFDRDMRKRLEMNADLSEGFAIRAGREMPTAGMRVSRIWDESGVAQSVDIRLPRRAPHPRHPPMP